MASPPVPLTAMRRGGTPRRRPWVHRIERCQTDPPRVSPNQCMGGRVVADLTTPPPVPLTSPPPCPPLRHAERGHERRAPVVGALLIDLKRRPPSPEGRGGQGVRTSA